MDAIKKLGVIGGAGLLGSTTAFCVALEGIADEIILTDMKENLAHAHAMDMSQAVCEHSGTIIRVGGIDDLETCDIVLNVAGIPEMKAGSRDDYLRGNILVYRELSEKLKRWGSCPVILCATNPVDVLNYSLYEMTGFPCEKLIGFSRNDSLRFVWSASIETGVPASNIDALVIGEHGEAQVPLFGTLKFKDLGKSLIIDESQKDNILRRVKEFFGEYQKLDSGRSSGWTSGAGLCHVIRMILTDSNEMCPCSVIPNGEYGLKGLSIGLPVKLGKSGVKEILKIDLTEDEKAMLGKAETKIKKMLEISRVF